MRHEGGIQHGPGYPAIYRQLANLLRHAIVTGELGPGALLPTERDLAHQHAIGLDTVRDALAVLRSEGLIQTRRGHGSRVRAAPERIVVHVGREARIRTRMPTDAERADMDLDEGVPVLVIRTGDHEEVLAGDATEVAYSNDPEDDG